MKAKDLSTREVRQQFADVVNAAIQGEITYITSRGRRVAALVPLEIATNAEKQPPRSAR